MNGYLNNETKRANRLIEQLLNENHIDMITFYTISHNALLKDVIWYFEHRVYFDSDISWEKFVIM